MVMPEVLPTGRVVWQIVVGVVDGPDADDRPDLIGAQGTVAFTASIPSTAHPVGDPNPYSLALTTKVGVLDEEGYLCTPDPRDPSKPGPRGMHLFATDNPGLANKGWTWTATPRLKDVNGQRLDGVIKPFSFAVPTMDVAQAIETPLDLAVLAPIPASQGLGKEQIAARAEMAVAAATSSAANAALAREESEHATRIALRVAERADAGEFKGEAGERGPAGPNTVPTQSFLNDYIGAHGIPTRVIHGDDAGHPRPEYAGPVDWYGSTIPLNRQPGDTYSVVATESAPWTPLQLPELLGWYKPDADSLAPGVAVATIPDHSGNNRHLRATTTPVQYEVTSVGTAGGLRFTKAGIYATEAFTPTGDAAITVFLLAKSLNTSGGTGTFYDGQTSGAMNLYRSAVSPNFGFGFRRSTGVLAAAGEVSDSNPHVFVATYDGTRSSLEIDGASYIAGATLGTTPVSSLTLGGRPDGTNKLDGSVAELFWVKGVLDDSAKAQAVDYLMARAGVN